jgi:lysophospholipid acyltransferase (LPLAT)-like uncharacterized protein
VDARELRKARREAVANERAEREARGRNKPGLTRFRRFRRRIGTVLIATLAPLLLRLLAFTWRVERRGEVGLELLSSERPWLVTLWHGSMLAMMPISRHCRRNIGVLVSPSDDGGLAKLALDKFGYAVVRGSLSKRGARAMREMHELLQQGGQLVITPDGPRGPRHSINTGAAWLARETGTPILPVIVAVSRAWRLRSWDRMCIPKPFARVVMHYGDPVMIAKDADDAALEAASSDVREVMLRNEGTASADLQVAFDQGETNRSKHA